MAKITSLLLLLILWSDANAWYCNYDNGEDGWYLEGTMVCDGIDVQTAIEDHYCEWHRPDDPYCDQFQNLTCADTVEYESEACPPNYTGTKNYVRYFTCNTDSWSEWSVSSDNCVALPYSCIATIEQKTSECLPGYEGSITEQRIVECPDPYGSPVYKEWHESVNTCTQSVSDPVSPISQTNPVTNPVSPTATEPVTAPTEVNVPVTSNPQPSNPVAAAVKESVEEESEPSSETESNESINESSNKEENKEDRQNKKTVKNKDQLADSSHEIVPGFGLTLSMDILQQPMTFYEPPLTDLFSMTQELPQSEDTRKFHLELFRQDYIEDYYDSLSDSTWQRLRGGSIY